MNKYESIFIIDPSLEEEKRKELIEKMKGIITSGGGKLLGLDEWGVRRLAYPVEGKEEGYYCFLNLEANPDIIQNLERNCRITDDIIRYLSVRIEEKKPKPKKVKPKKHRPGIQRKEEYERRGGRERWQE